MNDTLKQKTIQALLWSLVESVGLQLVRFVIGVVLARLLLPAQFGLIGMLAVFIAISESLVKSGFGSALIQKQNSTQIDACSVFYFNIIIGLLIAGVLCVSAPFIAAFYKQPELTAITRALSLVLVINSFSVIQNTIIIKEINFKILTKVSITANIFSGVIGIMMALYGYGVWSLVIQQISRAFFQTCLLWVFNSWRPSLQFSFDSLKELFGFGSRIVASGLLNQLFDNIYYVVIGRVFSASDLGFFTRARSLRDIPTQSLAGMVGRVTFPVFSTVQNDTARLKSGMKKALTGLSFINFPMMIMISMCARPIIIILFTEKWMASIPFLQLLCLIGLLFPIHLINLNVLQAIGRSDLFFRLEVLKKILTVINIAVTYHFGIIAMIYGAIIVSILSYFLNAYYNGIFIKYSIFEQIYDLIPYAGVTVLMALGIYFAGLFPYPNLWILLIVKILVGLIIYIGLSMLFRLDAFTEIWDIISDKLSLKQLKQI